MIFLSLKYLFSRRRQTLLMLLGIFFGTAAYVAISGFMLGFRGYLIDQLVNNNAHITIRAREDFLSEHSLDQSFFGSLYEHIFWAPAPSGSKNSAMVEDPQSWYKRLEADPRVLSYSPQLNAAVIFSNGKTFTSSTIIGCNPLQQVRITTIGDYMIEGKFSDLVVGGDRLVIGSELQRKLGVNVMQNVMVSLANGAPRPFKVIGIYSTSNRRADNGAYGAIADIQKINGTPSQVNEIGVRLVDYTQSAALATAWTQISGEKVESWDQANASIFDMFKLQDGVRFLSVGAIMIVAGFGIYNVLNMTVMQKRQDIAILRSMGYSTFDIISLFFFQGMILGLTGTALGLLFGYGICHYLQTIELSGGGRMGVSSNHLIISWNPAIYFQAAMLALVSATFASVLPARAAGKLTPIEIIRAGAE